MHTCVAHLGLWHGWRQAAGQVTDGTFESISLRAWGFGTSDKRVAIRAIAEHAANAVDSLNVSLS